VILTGAAVAATGCAPANPIDERVNRLPKDMRSVVRDAVWAHGNPYVREKQDNVVIEARWTDYRHGFDAIVNQKTYTIDLKSRRMRIDDHSEQSVALYDGTTWRVFARGQELKLPATVNADTVGYAAMFEYAAGEMRCIRTFFDLPFDMLDDGASLKWIGLVRSVGGGAAWPVVRMTFDPAVTGFLKTDRLMVYFDPVRGVVDRVYVELSDAPFYAIPHWGEWSDYRRLPNGMVVAHRWDFRMTDAKGGADLGRRLTIVLERVGFNLDLPGRVFSAPEVKPPPVPPEQPTPKVKTLGEDVIDSAP
jgi:hypothetical protein